MPPNRKSELSTEDLPTLDVTQLKQQLVQQQPAVQQQQQQQAKPDDAADYWTWPADPQVQALQDEAAVQALFSATHIEQNLKQVAQELRQAKTTTTTTTTTTAACAATTENYWDVPAAPIKECEVPTALYQHLQRTKAVVQQQEPRYSYWDWPTNDTAEEAGLQRVLDGQRARQITSATAVEANLLLTQNASAASPQPLHAANDSYWVF